MHIIAILSVAFGGAIGATLRYLISQISFLQTSFPWATFAVNLAGALLIGFIVGIAPSRLSPNALLCLKTGFCGGLTTFSTFSLEALSLFEKGRILPASIYILASVILCIFGVFAGRALAMRCIN